MYNDDTTEIASYYKAEDNSLRCSINDYEEDNSIELIHNIGNLGITLKVVDCKGNVSFLDFYTEDFIEFLDESRKCLTSSVVQV